MDDVLIEKLKKEIETFAVRKDSEVQKIGHVVRVGDGVAEIDGLSSAKMGEMVIFEKTNSVTVEDLITDTEILYGLVLNLEEEYVRAVILGSAHHVMEGMKVKSTGKILSIPVGESLIGRIVSPLGEPLDGRGSYNAEVQYPIEREAYGVIDRQSVNTPLHTGIKAIDSMIPIGRGQRELIIGDRFTGKTTIAIDTILNQLNERKEDRPICIYVAIGQKESKTARIVADLKEAGAMEYTIVVNASAATPAALQFLAPFAGASIGEYFMDQGRDALVIYDDLSKQAVAYRGISLLLRRPPGREAYPGDIFYLHSRLLERAAKLSAQRGGGSLTALPIIETQEGDVSSYIPTNVISITDGQIYLDTSLFNRGLKPAINVGLSVSRVGSAAQTKAMKKVAGKIRLELAQFRELEAFVQFSQDLDIETRKRIENGERLTEVLTQTKGKPYGFERQVVIIFAAIHGYLADVLLSRVVEFESAFLTYIDTHHNDLLQHIKKERDLAEKQEEELRNAFEQFKLTHKELFLQSNRAWL
ncbi:MAG TPA: F0F1 ATP synthase subunit alpha [Candidatus Paceibacterota bacterium]